MIYNIKDEKRKSIHQSIDDFSGYVSEEALMELIEQVETQEMLRAPVHLKENVLTQIRRERKAAGKRQIFAYRAKVLIAMAAALTVLILMPTGEAEGSGHKLLQEQPSTVSMEQTAMERQKNIDNKWEQYMEERSSGGIRGFFEDINTKVTQLGRNLSEQSQR